MVELRKGSTIGQKASGFKVKEGSQSEVRPVYRLEYATCGISIALAHETWGRYLPDNADYFFACHRVTE